jgi:hypothetical protein
MANTVIQIKRSTVTTAPTAGSLAAAEQAYSYLSDKLFIGSSDGTQVIEIGGRYYVNTAVRADQTANAANIAAGAAFDKANAANVLAFNTGIGANAYAATVGTGANNYLLTVIAGANTAVGAGANAFTSATIAGANTAVGAGANAYAATVGTGANNYLLSVIAGANTAVGAGANAYASAAAAGANAYMITVQNGANTAVGAGANAYAATLGTSVGTGANAYSDSTFVKLTASNQTVTGNLTVTGSLTVSGNAFTIDTETLRVSDPLIYLAGNNYSSDIVDIGFVANYVNATGQNVHTGLFRDATIKEYYLFQGYDKEPTPNHIDTSGNNFSIAVLNATVKTSNLILGGANAILTIASVGTSANAFASATIAGANTAVGAGANAYAATVGTGANNYLLAVIAGANTAVGAGANAYAATVGTGANNYLLAVIAGANTAVGAGANAYATAAAAGANAYMISVQNGANTAVGAGANAYALSISSGIGAGSNAYADLVGAAANTNAANASYINTGILAVAYGGTGRNTFANNGVLFGNTTSGIRVTAAGTEGNVLQVNNQGTPLFGMLDGGTF